MGFLVDLETLAFDSLDGNRVLVCLNLFRHIYNILLTIRILHDPKAFALPLHMLLTLYTHL